MDIWTTDRSLVPQAFIENFDSFLWAERFQELGDFEIVTSDPTTINRLPIGQLLRQQHSDRAMIVERVEQSGKSGTVKISGRSIESLLTQRGVAPIMMVSRPKGYETTAPVEQLPEQVVALSLGAGMSVHAPWRIPGLYSPMPPVDSGVVTFVPFGKTWDVVRDIVRKQGRGVKIVCVPDAEPDRILQFQSYSGVDRTITSSAGPALIFASDLENLEDVSLVRDNSNWYNMALIHAFGMGVAMQFVYLDGTASGTSGYDRRVLFLNYSDRQAEEGQTTEQFAAQLREEARLTLLSHRKVSAIDGRVPTNGKLKYGIDFGLGDLVKVRDDSGKYLAVRIVSEYIWAIDAEGPRMYPTFTEQVMG